MKMQSLYIELRGQYVKRLMLFGITIFSLTKTISGYYNLFILGIPVLRINRKKDVYSFSLLVFTWIGKFLKKIIQGKSIGYTNYEKLENSINVLCDYMEIDKEILKIFKYRKAHVRSCTMKNYNADKEVIEGYINSIDPKTLSKATGELRAYQNDLLEFTHDVIAYVEKLGFHPSMSGGTLLGAVRHSGFIPWDDDVDFDLPRDEYNQLFEILKEKWRYIDTSRCFLWKNYLELLELSINKYPNEMLVFLTTAGLKVFKGTSIDDYKCVDFFAWDFIAPQISEKQFGDFLKKHRYDDVKLGKVWGSMYSKMDDIVKNSGLFVNRSERFYFGIGAHGFWQFPYHGLRSTDTWFPLRRMKFEKYDFYAPNNPEQWLIDQYGRNYNKIPTMIVANEHINTTKQLLKLK